MNQLSFLDVEKPKPTGAVLRDKGIKKALNHAEDIHNDWQRQALDFLCLYARNHYRFSGEMVRMASKEIVPCSPSLRAWGSIMLSGARKGWIRQVGYIKVENPLAHRTPATLWESCLRKED